MCRFFDQRAWNSEEEMLPWHGRTERLRHADACYRCACTYLVLWIYMIMLYYEDWASSGHANASYRCARTSCIMSMLWLSYVILYDEYVYVMILLRYFVSCAYYDYLMSEVEYEYIMIILCYLVASVCVYGDSLALFCIMRILWWWYVRSRVCVPYMISTFMIQDNTRES